MNLMHGSATGSVPLRELLFYAGSVFFLTGLTTWTVHLYITEELLTPDLQASAGLLSYNFMLSVLMLKRFEPEMMSGSLSFGLLLLVAKLFVNTFTIFLLIGLQAVRTPVFVPVFFVGYFVLLGSTVWALHRTTIGK